MTEKIYPSWRYHAVKDALIVKSAEEEAKLGPDWFESPAHFEQAAEVIAPKKPEPMKKTKSKGEGKA